MKADSLNMLRGEQQQGVEKTLNEIKASIVEQKKEIHCMEEKV